MKHHVFRGAAWRAGAIAAATLLLSACSSMSATPGDQLKCPQCAPLPAGYRTEIYAQGLSHPVSLAWAPDGRLFVAERSGAIRVVTDGSLQSTPWATIRDVRVSDDAGLLGIAVDPRFDETHYVYVYYTELAASARELPLSVLERLTDDGTAGGQPARLMDDLLGAPDAMNTGGVIHFGPDGKLYAATGDTELKTVSEDPSDPRGKLLRLDADGRAAPDNVPPAGATAAPADARVFASGFSQPGGFAFDANSGALYVVDGRAADDEIHLVRAGGNYAGAQSSASAGAAAEAPVEIYRPAAGTFGIASYGAGRLSEFRGDLFTCSSVGGVLRRLQLNPEGTRAIDDQPIAPFCTADVAQGPDGFLYFVDSAHGRILRIRN